MTEAPIAISVNVWNDMGHSLPDLRDTLRDSGFKGVLLVGPDEYGIDEHVTLPLMGFRVFSALERFGVSFDWSAMLVVVRVESNEVFAGRVSFVRDDYTYVAPRERPRDALVATQFFVRNVSERLHDFALRPGTYLSTVLLNEETSNRVRTRVTHGAAAERDPAVVEFLERHRKPEEPPKPIKPARTVLATSDAALDSSHCHPTYRAQGNSPPVPEEPGIAMSVERVVLVDQHPKSILHGSFRLPVSKRNLVPRTEPTAPNEVSVPLVDVGDPDATAVVPISLVIVGNLYPGPTSHHLRVPSYDPVDPKANDGIVTGHFDVDLLAFDDMQRLPQTYYIWAFSGEIMAGPNLMAIVTPDMLREV
jgi:hypothetical protein